MVNKNVPTCARCTGKHWVDLGVIEKGEFEDVEGSLVQTSPDIHLMQCGGGLAHDEQENMKQGCMRVIRATLEEMEKGGMI